MEGRAEDKDRSYQYVAHERRGRHRQNRTDSRRVAFLRCSRRCITALSRLRSNEHVPGNRVDLDDVLTRLGGDPMVKLEVVDERQRLLAGLRDEGNANLDGELSPSGLSDFVGRLFEVWVWMASQHVISCERLVKGGRGGRGGGGRREGRRVKMKGHPPFSARPPRPPQEHGSLLLGEGKLSWSLKVTRLTKELRSSAPPGRRRSASGLSSP